MTQVEMLHFFWVVQKQTGFKTHLTKGSFKISMPLGFERERCISHFIVLFVLNHYLFVLNHYLTFWSTHFFQRHSLGKCHLVHWLFHWVPFVNNYCLLDESLNIPVSLSGGKVNSLVYQNVSLELIRNNKPSMFSLMEVITLISVT